MDEREVDVITHTFGGWIPFTPPDKSTPIEVAHARRDADSHALCGASPGTEGRTRRRRFVTCAACHRVIGSRLMSPGTWPPIAEGPRGSCRRAADSGQSLGVREIFRVAHTEVVGALPGELDDPVGQRLHELHVVA